MFENKRLLLNSKPMKDLKIKGSFDMASSSAGVIGMLGSAIGEMATPLLKAF
jgi:hypothetical protein